ncbi:hypothetical protein EDD85DRAFT_226287 [Armillaria nabsnona]|nr:hypothetical protein EDD85DRAFT_226287 [Armillaria nabsnona]
MEEKRAVRGPTVRTWIFCAVDTSSCCSPVCTSWILSIRPFPAGDCLPSLRCCAIHTRSPLSSTEPCTACTTSRATVVGSTHPVNVVMLSFSSSFATEGTDTHVVLYTSRHIADSDARGKILGVGYLLPVSLWTIHISTEHRLRVLPNISFLRERCRHPFVSLARSPPGHGEFRVCVMRWCVRCVCVKSRCVCVNACACALLCMRWKKCVDAFDACACVTDVRFLGFSCVSCCFGFCA